MPAYEELYTKSRIAQLIAEEHIVVPCKEEMTCYGCDIADTCEWAWDLYNTHGDCIADK